MLTDGIRGLRRTTEPAALAVSVADCQAWGAITDDTAVLTLMIEGMTDIAEKYMKRALITQKWKMSLDRWPGMQGDWWDMWHSVRGDESGIWLELPYAPLSAVDSINTYDTSDTATAITIADVFLVDTNAEPGRIGLRTGQQWPVDTRNIVRIEINYTNGYGATEASVPQGIKTGLMQAVTWQYEHRGDCDAGSAFVKSGAALALRTYKIMDVD